MTGLLTTAAAGGGAGLGLAGGIYFFKWLLEHIAGRMDKQRAGIDAGTQRLIENLERRLTDVTTRLDKVETELSECREKHAESEARVKHLEAIMQGYGDARQHAQLIVSEEKRKAAK